jgi:hypothetical protein
MSREVLKISVFTKNESIEYEGRLLGVITPTEFHKIVNQKKWKGRAFTSETVTLRDFASSFPKDEDVAGLRLAIAIKKKDRKTLVGKKLFISEPLDFISNVGKADKPDLTLNAGDSSTYIVLEKI